jgi:DNA (cytosine-5)-methyltransferase 1
MTGKPRLLDLFCGAGGAGMGYHQAGFDVVGVDLRPVGDEYPFEFHQADALTYPLDGFDVIHASPPCQGYSLGVRSERAKATPQLIDKVRDRLTAWGGPWVIENVKGARHAMKATPDGYFVLCGSMWSDDIPVRHRLFETRPFLWPPAHQKCIGHNKRLAERLGVNRRMVDVATVHENVPLWRDLMGMPWAGALGLSLAIPPIYTEWIGRQLMAVIEAERVA